MLAGMAPNPTLPLTSMTLADARTKLSGLHFAKECLSDGERDILYVAEALLRLIDSTTGEALTGTQERMRMLATSSGVHAATLYTDGVEFAGSLGDSDAQAGFVPGEYTVEQVKAAIGALPLRVDVR